MSGFDEPPLGPDLSEVEKWLCAAEANWDAANRLLARGPANLSLFHSLQAVELAIKGIRMMGATFSGLLRVMESLPKPQTHEYLEHLAQVIALTSPQPTTRKHDLPSLLTHEWIHDDAIRESEAFIVSLQASIGNYPLYEACRYPDALPPGRDERPYA